MLKEISALFLLLSLSAAAQQTGIQSDTLTLLPQLNTKKFTYTQLILPAALITYGVVGLGSDQ